MFENKNILITGATGFVGYHLAKRLVKKNLVYCLVRNTSNLDKLKKISGIKFIIYEDSLETLLNDLRDIQFDLVYHLASFFVAEHKSEHINNLIDSNIKFPTQLLEILTNNQKHVKLVNTGTSWQNYDDSNYNPVCLYAATKQSFEDIIKYYHEVRALSCITLRLYDTYGPRDERKKLFWLLNSLKETGESLDMSMGEQKLNLVYIDDVIDAFICAGCLLFNNINKKLNEVYGVYANQDYSLKEVVTIFEQVNKCELNIRWGKRGYRIRELMQPKYFNPILDGWFARIELVEGLKNILL